ncbi:hypothetical protein [Bauldia sp.]|uniref:hypothetical protein n=1 Tax=Bauldia sp. TaxID=2575872 RepID=UPI003BAC48EA
MPTQKNDIFAFDGNGIGILFSKPDQKWKINEGVFIAAGNIAVASEFEKSKLINKGELFSNNVGVIFTKDDSNFINKKEGSILSGRGVEFSNGSTIDKGSVENHGVIRGLNDYGVVAEDVTKFELSNYGKIVGTEIGAAFDSILEKGPKVENEGLIKSIGPGENAAVYMNDSSDVKLTVINKADGTIEGLYSIVVDDGRLDLKNHGKLKGDVILDSTGKSDKIINKGDIKGQVFLGSGDDTYKNKDGKAGKIFSQDGNDKLTAGNSKDKFAFIGPLDAATNVDRIKEFESGKDKFFLDQNVFTALTGPGGLESSEFRKSKNAKDNDDFMLYHKNSGRLWYDADADGVGGKVLIARLDEGQKLNADDFEVALFA